MSKRLGPHGTTACTAVAIFQSHGGVIIQVRMCVYGMHVCMHAANSKKMRKLFTDFTAAAFGNQFP